MDIIIRIPETRQEWESYYDLRYRILRQPLGKPRGSERNEGDENGIHFALYQNNVLKAIARLDEHEPAVAQTRFVAVETDESGKGYGKWVMQAVEQKAIELGYTKMMLHARENAVDFYLKLGYEMVAPSHKLFDQVQHFLMEKTL